MLYFATLFFSPKKKTIIKSQISLNRDFYYEIQTFVPKLTLKLTVKKRKKKKKIKKLLKKIQTLKDHK